MVCPCLFRGSVTPFREQEWKYIGFNFFKQSDLSRGNLMERLLDTGLGLDDDEIVCAIVNSVSV